MRFLIAQSTYSDIQIGLFDSSLLVDQKTISKFNVCKELIPTIQTLLKNNKINFGDLQFIGINQGPAPFNRLRALISTINGLAYATKIPLVGINGIKALYRSSRSPQTVVLLNAFNNEVYYAYKKQNELAIGAAHINDVLKSIVLDLPHGAITFLGNVTEQFKDQIIMAFGNRTHIDSSSTSHELALEVLAQICLNKFTQGELLPQLQPLYLKRAV